MVVSSSKIDLYVCIVSVITLYFHAFYVEHIWIDMIDDSSNIIRIKICLMIISATLDCSIFTKLPKYICSNLIKCMQNSLYTVCVNPILVLTQLFRYWFTIGLCFNYHNKIHKRWMTRNYSWCSCVQHDSTLVMTCDYQN